MTSDPASTADAVEWFDNHCHLTTLKIDTDEVVAEAAASGVTRMLTVGCTVDDSKRAIEIAARYPNVWATAGVHPHDATDGTAGLADLLGSPEVVAVGECGLDYHYEYSPRSEQAEVFASQIQLAHENDLALVIHTREAWADTFAILDQQGIPPRTVFHCFTGGPDEAQECLARGALLSFSGIVTFKAAEELRQAVKITPPDRLLVETDSPYLAPVPHRGQPNRPALVSVVGAAVSQILGLDPADVARLTVANGRRLYQL